MDSTERFWRDWTSGAIDGVPCVPCRSDDLYELYRLWAQREGLPRAAQKQTLITALGKKPGAAKAQERFMDGAGLEKKVVFYPPGDQEPAGAQSKQRWLGDQVTAFRTAVNDWRGDYK